MFVHEKKRDRNSRELYGSVLTAEFSYCRSEFLPMLWPFLFIDQYIGKKMLSSKMGLWPGTECLQQEREGLIFSLLFLQWQTLPHSQGWCDREIGLVPTGKFASALGETGGQKFYTAGYKLYSENFLTCSKIASCNVFLIRPGRLHLQRKHQFHLVTKHRDVYCLVLLSRRGPGLFTAGTCDKRDNIN